MIAACVATTLALCSPFLYVAIMGSIRADRKRKQWEREAPGFWREWR